MGMTARLLSDPGINWIDANPGLSWDPEHPTAYENFRTGLDFWTIVQCLRHPSSDPSNWQHKRRGTILGVWCMLKRHAYDEYTQTLDQIESEMSSCEIESVF